MAVTLIPQRKRKKRVGIGIGVLKESKQAAFAAVILGVVFAVYGGLWVYQGVLTSSLDALRSDAGQLGEEIDTASQERARLFAVRLGQVKGLLDGHVYSSDIFEIIENVTHPRVQFTSFSFSTKDGLATMSAVTDGYVNFGRQIIALEQNENIHDLRVSDIGLNKKGEVAFKVIFKLDKSIYTNES